MPKRKHLDKPKLDIEAVKKLSDPARDVLFKEYSNWARHHHTLVWTVAAFGATFPLAAISLYDKFGLLPYTIIAVGSLFLLGIADKLAEGNRHQWQDYKSVANLIEASWSLRVPGNEASLNFVERRRDVRVQPWRRLLYLALAIIVAATIVAKWKELY